MTTLQEFIDKWNGKPCEMGGSANALNQCVDLANAYITEVLQYPAIFWTNAQDFPSKAGDKYDYILNTPTGVPQPGDIVIWKSKDNVGHIGIFNDGNSTSFHSFDQNWPVGSKCHLQYHTYKTGIGTDVVGWLRAKKSIDTMYRGLDLSNSESMKICVDDHLKIVEGKVVDAEELIKSKARIEELTRDIADLSHKLGESNAQLLAVSTELDQKNQALIRELESQHDFADQASRASDERDVIKKVLSDMLWEVEDELKLPHPNDGIDTRVSVALGALQALVASKTVIKGLSDYSIIVKFGTIIYKR